MESSLIKVEFPYGGVDLVLGAESLMVRPVVSDHLSEEVSEITCCSLAENSRSVACLSGFSSGGSRCGWAEIRQGGVFMPDLIGDAGEFYSPVIISFIDGKPYEISIRTGVYREIVGPRIYSMTRSTDVGCIYGATYNNNVYFVDGENYTFYSSADDRLYDWTEEYGDLPYGVDDSENIYYCRLIESWNGRILLSGLETDPNVIFASAIGNPNDWEYNVSSPGANNAWFLSSGNVGRARHPITAMIPAADSTLFIGTLSSIEMLRGDVLSGGRKEIITETMGMPWGRPWSIDPDGGVWFVSTNGDVYSISTSGNITIESRAISPILSKIDQAVYSFMMAWNNNLKARGLHLFAVPRKIYDSPIAAGKTAKFDSYHFFCEYDTRSWWLDTHDAEFAASFFGPTAVSTINGLYDFEKTVLTGGYDNVARRESPESSTDCGREFNSHVLIGPISTDKLEEVMWDHVQIITALGSDLVTVSVLAGRTAEEALASKPVVVKTVGAGRSHNIPVKKAAYALYIRIGSKGKWALEKVRVTAASLGSVRMRGR